MFMMNKGQNTLHRVMVNVIYKLIFHGLKKFNFHHVTYFALTFAAQMIVLEYYEDYQRLELMLVFFLYRFLPFYIIKFLKLDFTKLFERFSDLIQNSFDPNQMGFQNSNYLKTIDYRVKSDLDIFSILKVINMYMCEMINQITYCRSELTQELINLMVIEPAQQENPPSKEKLRQSYFKIELIRNVDVMNCLLKVNMNRGQKIKIIQYNNLNVVKKYLLGRPNPRLGHHPQHPGEAGLPSQDFARPAPN